MKNLGRAEAQTLPLLLDLQTQIKKSMRKILNLILILLMPIQIKKKQTEIVLKSSTQDTSKFLTTMTQEK